MSPIGAATQLGCGLWVQGAIIINKPPLAPRRSQWRQYRRFRVHGSQQDPAPNDSNTQPTTAPPRPSAPAPAPPPVQWTFPSRRRQLLAGLAGVGIVLGSNFLGTTSRLLSLDGGQLAARLRIDTFVPVNGYKRCVDYQNGFEFVYPDYWLADQRLYYRYAERIEQRTGLDPPSLSGRRPQRDYAEPAAAFGPPGSTGEENMSVIVAPVRTGFRLQAMGTPEEAAATFMTVFAPPGSDKTAQLLGAASREGEDGQLYYEMEYTVRGPSFFRHNRAVYASRNDLLYTLNCQCPEERWAEVQGAFRAAGSSFRIFSSGSGTQGYPDAL